MKKAAAYCRYSSDNQREESIEGQLRAISEYCLKNDIELVKVYRDEARSATSDDRPEFLVMIRESSNYDCVIVHKLDRFARNRYDSAFYRKKLKDNGCRLISVMEPLDESPESVILESVLEGMAEYFSRNLSREVKKGKKETALEAKFNGGTPPTGYDVVNKKYVINEQEALAVKKIYELYLYGYGYKNIASELNSLGFRSKRGQAFGKNSIRDILLNEKYTGVYIHGKNTGEAIRIEDGIPQIIDKETFEKVQEKINKRKRGPRMDGKRLYLLVGLVECGQCGSSYSGNSYVRGGNGVKNYIYSCVGREKNKSCDNKRVRQDVIEQFVMDELKRVILNINSIEIISKQLAKMLEEQGKEVDKERKYLKTKISEQENKINRALDLALDGLLDRGILVKKINSLKAELQDFQERLEKIDTDYGWVDEGKISAFLKASLFDLENKEQRKLIETFVEKVIVHKEEIEVIFKIDPDNFSPDRGKVGGAKAYLTIPLTVKRQDLFEKYVM